MNTYQILNLIHIICFYLICGAKPVIKNKNTYTGTTKLIATLYAHALPLPPSSHQRVIQATI